jgi:hypothetical protein
MNSMNATGANDKRESDRRLLGQLLRVSDLQTDNVVGSLVNLSRGGFMLISKVPVEANQVSWFSLELPEPVEGHRRVSLEARCVWCQQSSFSTDYGAGFEIRQMSEDDRRRLTTLYGSL